jgi:hypothetical protein
VRSETPLSVWHDGDAVALTTVDEDLYEFATAPGAAYLLMPAGSAPPPVAPARVGVGFTGETGITLSFQSVDGLQYELHKSVDGMGSWQPSGDPVVSASGGLMELQDENGKPAEGESVFYRVTVTN